MRRRPSTTRARLSPRADAWVASSAPSRLTQTLVRFDAAILCARRSSILVAFVTRTEAVRRSPCVAARMSSKLGCNVGSPPETTSSRIPLLSTASNGFDVADVEMQRLPNLAGVAVGASEIALLYDVDHHAKDVLAVLDSECLGLGHGSRPLLWLRSVAGRHRGRREAPGAAPCRHPVRRCARERPIDHDRWQRASPGRSGGAALRLGQH